ncbi:uncharacterized protein [Dysidea avara]|uniref:uncharacterized protein isoform X2 n=1 Tax=Dysidea avara TaxID=196820 RepID=UPI0033198F71
MLNGYRYSRVANHLMDGTQLKECIVLRTHYSKLCNTLVDVDNLLSHFVQEGIISANDLQELKAMTRIDSKVQKLLHHVSGPLQSGNVKNFNAMLTIMEEHGTIATKDLAITMRNVVSTDTPVDDSTKLDGCKVIGEQGLTVQTEPALHKPDNTKDVNLGVFDINDRVEDIFITFVSELSDILKASKCEFTLLRSSCIKSDMPLARVNKLPSDFVDKVDATSNLNELLELLNKSSHCNWMNIRVFERMAAASKQSKAKTLVTNYKKIIFSKKINDILEELPDLEITDDYYTKVKDKWSKDLKDITISDVVDRWCKLQKIFDVEDLEILLQNIIKGSIIFHWLIPACLVTQVRYSVFRNWYNLEDFAYLCIGSHMIKDDQFDFNEDCLSATTATPQQVIDHFTDFLLVSLNDQLLLPLMQSHGLLTDYDLELIDSGPTGYHKNQLILTCVQLMDDTSLSVFSKLLQDSHPDVKIPLQDALSAKGILLSKQVTEEQSSDSQFHQSTVSTEIKSRKRQLSLELSYNAKHIKCSIVSKEFLKLVDKLNEVLKSCDPKMIIDQCSSLMASDIHNISVFPDEFIKNLQRYNYTPSLLKILGSFWTWSDHSILRTLLRDNDEALKLLDEYDSQLDPLQKISSYPLPPPSPCMTPCDGSTHTVMAIKCAQQYHQCHLKNVFDVRSSIISKCDITPHCPQLLATNAGSTVLYWLIPKSVAKLIGTKLLECSTSFYDVGILEVSIFPGTRITTNTVNLASPLAFLSPIAHFGGEGTRDKAFAELMSHPEEIPVVVDNLMSELEEKSVSENDVEASQKFKDSHSQTLPDTERDTLLKQISELQFAIKNKDMEYTKLKFNNTQLFDEKSNAEIVLDRKQKELDRSKEDYKSLVTKHWELRSHHATLTEELEKVKMAYKELMEKDIIHKEPKEDQVSKLEDAQQNIEKLLTAAKEGNVEVLDSLLTMKKYNVNDIFDDKSAFKAPLLHVAARRGQVKIVKKLLDENANVDVVDTYGQTALHMAARKGHREVIQVLLEANASVNAASNIGTTPLHAVAYGDPTFSEEIIELLINSGANIDVVDNDGDSALNKAAFCGNLEAAKALMKFGPNVSLANQNGTTPLTMAVKHKRGTVVWYFVKECKMDITQFDQEVQDGIHHLVKMEDDKQTKQ